MAIKAVRMITSIRLTVILLTVIILLSIGATLFPQPEASGFYRSPVYLIPLGLFFINLLACTAKRIFRRYKTDAPKRFGPDIIHIAILGLMLAGVQMMFTRLETTVYLAPGDSVELPAGLKLRLRDLTFSTYDDSRPKEWISDLALYYHEEKIAEKAIEVNQPLASSGFRFFQSGYKMTPYAVLMTEEGRRIHLSRDEMIKKGDDYYDFTDYSTKNGIFQITMNRVNEAGQKESGHIIRRENSWMGFYLEDLEFIHESGIMIVYQPGTQVIIALMGVLALGLCVTSFQRLYDQKKTSNRKNRESQKI